MAEQLYYDKVQAKWFVAEREKITEAIEKLNYEIFDCPNDEEKSDYEPISLDAITSYDGLPIIVLNFHEPRYRFEDL